MSGPAYQATETKPIWPRGGPGPARLRHNQAYRLRPGQIPENFDRPGPALLTPGLPGPLGTLGATRMLRPFMGGIGEQEAQGAMPASRHKHCCARREPFFC